MMEFNVAITGAVSRVELNGVIDEHSDFSALFDQIAGDVEVDLDGLSRVNSSGLLRWLKFVQRVNDSGGVITLKRCRPHFVDQLNMVYQLSGDRGQVSSFYVPYECEPCAIEIEILLRSGEVRSRWAPERKCPTCAQAMKFEDSGNYFHFLGSDTTGYVELNLPSRISTADASADVTLLKLAVNGGVINAPEGLCKRGESAILEMAHGGAEAATLRAVVGHVSVPVRGLSRVDLTWELVGEANIQRFQKMVEVSSSDSSRTPTMSVLARSQAHRDFVLAELAKGDLTVQCTDVLPLDGETVVAIITEDGSEMPPQVEEIDVTVVSISRAKDGRVFVGLRQRVRI